MATDVVTCFLRNDGRVLLNRRAEDAPTYPGRWAGVSGAIEPAETPEAAAYREVAEETGVDDPDPVRSGGVLSVEDDAAGRTWNVHPFLFDVDTRAVEDSKEYADLEWVHPPAILRRETVPALWRAYERVAPTVRSVAADDEHGSAYVSVRALEVLRDRAGRLATDAGDWDELADLARRLRTARPDMSALANRIDRAMAAASEDVEAGEGTPGVEKRTPAAVERAATDGIDRALMADETAANNATDRIDGECVLTLSRSGTVLSVLRRGDPAAVFVAESRPGGEGIAVAEALAADATVTLHADAAVADVLARRDVDLVLVGVDTVREDGGVVNKVGTRGAALAADHEDVPLLAVAASDKIATGPVPLESTANGGLYDGDAPVHTHDPLFDETPPALVSGVVTERGTLPPSAVSEVAAELRALSRWDEAE
jgi:translation initiation factor 2B subunit (eIF-2B alpha/beta/delta family)